MVTSNKQSFLSKFLNWFFVCYAVAVCAKLFFSSGIWLYNLRFNSPLIFAAILLALSLIPGAILKERWRRRREGFFVHSRRREGGEVVYNEGGKLLYLYYDSSARVIYVPSNRAWEREMPDWAISRKEEIMSRIEKHLKSWKHQEIEHVNIARWPKDEERS